MHCFYDPDSVKSLQVKLQVQLSCDKSDFQRANIPEQNFAAKKTHWSLFAPILDLIIICVLAVFTKIVGPLTVALAFYFDRPEHILEIPIAVKVWTQWRPIDVWK